MTDRVIKESAASCQLKLGAQICDRNREQGMQRIPDQYGHPGFIAALEDFGPGVLDHHLLLVGQRAQPLHVVQLSIPLHPLHLGAQWRKG